MAGDTNTSLAHSTQISTGRRRTSIVGPSPSVDSIATCSSSGLDSEPPSPPINEHSVTTAASTRTAAALMETPTRAQQHRTVGMGRPSNQFDSLHDLLQRAGYKETRVLTPQSQHQASPSHSPSPGMPPPPLARSPSAAQRALTLNIRSHAHLQQLLLNSSAELENPGWFASLLRPRRTTSTSVLPRALVNGEESSPPAIPPSSSDPTIAATAPNTRLPVVTIDPSSPILPDAGAPQELARRITDGLPRLAPPNRPTLRKRASRSSHALWTGSLAYRRSQTLAVRHSPPTEEHPESQGKEQLARPAGPRHAHTVGPAAISAVRAAPPSRNARPRPSLQAAFASSPTKTKQRNDSPSTSGQPASQDVRVRRAEFDAQYQSHRRQQSNASVESTDPSDTERRPISDSSRSTSVLMAHPALPILSAAPAVALRHEACLIPVGISLSARTMPTAARPVIASAATPLTEEPQSYVDGQTAQSARPLLGRMRSVDLLRDALDAMQRIRESDADAGAVLAAVDEVGYATTSLGDISASSSTSTDSSTTILASIAKSSVAAQAQAQGEAASVEVEQEAPSSRGARTTSSSGTLLSVNNSLGDAQEAGDKGIPSQPSLPKLFLSSPRGITGPQRIGLESILDPPSDTKMDGAAAGTTTTTQLGLGFSFFSLFGRGRNKSAGGTSVFSISPSKKPNQAAAAGPLPEIVIGNMSNTPPQKPLSMISSDSVEAELDRMLAGCGTSSSAASSSPLASPSKARAARLPNAAAKMERRSSSDSLEVVKPLRLRRRRRRSGRRSVSEALTGGSGTSSATPTMSGMDGCDKGDDDADSRGRRRRSGGSSSSSSSSSPGMSPSQLDRIESALRGHAGTLSGARRVSAMRSDVESVRASRAGEVGAGADAVAAASIAGADGANSSVEDMEVTIRKPADEEADNPFIVKEVLATSSPPACAHASSATPDEDSSAQGSGASSAGAVASAEDETPVRKFLAGLVELETPARAFGAPEFEDVLGPLPCHPSSQDATSVLNTQDEAAASAQPTRAALSERASATNSGSNSPAGPRTGKSSKADGTKSKVRSSPSAVIENTTDENNQDSGSQRQRGGARSRRKTILAISHSDVRRRPSHPSLAARSSSQSQAGSFHVQTPPSLPAQLPNIALSDLLDTQGRMRPHVVLVSEHNNGESPTSAMLAQRAVRRTKLPMAASPSAASSGRPLRNATSQPVLGSSAALARAIRH